jgi:ribosomal protein S18 acetylase RimI-like enzyme
MTTIREFLPSDYPAALALWQSTEGVGLNESDTEPAISSFLERNPALSAVAIAPDGTLIGAVLCGHDGRRGYLHHLAVSRPHRRQGIARALLDHCFAALASHNIPKCNIFLYSDNRPGQAFWLHNGWQIRETLRLVQKSVP